MPTHLSGQFEPYRIEDHGSRWADLWSKSTTPWDRGQASPALVDLIENESLRLFEQVKQGRKVLVPGCGTGYDVVYLSKALKSAYGVTKACGLDIAKEATVAAREYAAKQNATDAVFYAGDFFNVEEGEWHSDCPFDLIYDYTVSETCHVVLYY